MSLFELQTLIYEALKIDAITQLGGIYDYIPEDKFLPFIVIGDDEAVEWDTKTWKGWEITCNINVWGGERSMKTVKNLIDEARKALVVDHGIYEYHKTMKMSAQREAVEYVHGILSIVYRIEEEP